MKNSPLLCILEIAWILETIYMYKAQEVVQCGVFLSFIVYIIMLIDIIDCMVAVIYYLL
jgi:hypothetical protein